VENKMTQRFFGCLRLFAGMSALLLFAFSSPAQAQGKLKRLVFEDCEKAEQKIVDLQGDDRAEFLSYLVRVLKMQTGVPGELADESAPAMSPQVGNLPGGNLWRIFEPSREIEAKQCALKLINARGEEAFFLLPDLVQVYQDGALPPEIREGVEQAVWNITNSVKNSPKGPPDPKIYSALISQLGAERSGFLAANALIELHSTTLPYLLSALSSPDMKRRAAVQDLLLRLDSNGEIIGPSIVPLLDSADEDLRVKGVNLLAELEQFYPKAIPVLISRLSDPAPTVEEAVFQAFRRIFAGGPIVLPIALEPAHITTLFSALIRSSFERRSVLEPLLQTILMQRPELASQLTPLAKSPDADLRERTVRMLSQSKLPPEAAVPVITEALYDPAYPVRIAAVHGLSSTGVATADIATALVRALKNVSADRDVLQREIFTLAVADTASKLPPTPALERLTPYFVDALAFRGSPASANAPAPIENEAVRALVRFKSSAAGPVTKALKSDDPLVRRRAVFILSQFEPRDRQTAKALVFMLRDADSAVRDAAVEAMKRFGTESEAEVEKGLTWKEPDDRLAAARVLVALGKSTPVIAGVFRDSFSRASCAEKPALVGPLVKLDPEYREKVQPFLVDCMIETPTAALSYADILAVLLPLQPAVVSRLDEQLQTGTFPMNVRLQILRHAPKAGVPPADVARALLQMLGQADNSLKNQIVGFLPELGQAAAAAIEPLKELIEDERTDGALRNQSALALSQLAPSSFHWDDFFLKELNSEHSQWALKTIAEMSAVQAVPFLDKALKQLPPERRGTVLALAGSFGPDAAPLKPTLIQYVKDPDPATRHQAVLALAQVDLNEPELLPALRRELIGPFAVDMQRDNLPAGVVPLLEQIIAQPKSFVEQRSAAAVIAELSER